MLDEKRETGERFRRERDVAEWAWSTLGFEADAAQERVLNSPSKRVALNCTRQWGKSTVTAAKAVHEATVRAGSLTIAVSPTARQTGEFLRKAAGFVRKLKMRVKGDGDNEMSLEFPNGSRIVGLPGNEATVRGFSAVSLLLVDEAARVGDMRVKVTSSGREQYEAGTSGQHDDLVSALALACWAVKKVWGGTVGERRERIL